MTDSLNITQEFYTVENSEKNIDSDLRILARKSTEISTCSKFNDCSTE